MLSGNPAELDGAIRAVAADGPMPDDLVALFRLATVLFPEGRLPVAPAVVARLKALLAEYGLEAGAGLDLVSAAADGEAVGVVPRWLDPAIIRAAQDAVPDGDPKALDRWLLEMAGEGLADARDRGRLIVRLSWDGEYDGLRGRILVERDA